MRKIIILSMAILFLAGCKVPELLGLKEMPVTQVATQDAELRQLKVMPVTQVVEKMKEREKLYNLSAKDMELRKILFLFAEELPEYNVVVDPDVAGRVTVDLKELPLDDVMTILLDPLGLEYTLEDDILRISKPRMVTRVFEFVYSTTNRSAQTSLVAMTGGGSETSGGQGSGSSSTSFGSVSTEEDIDVWGEMESGISDLLSEEGKLGISKRIGRISVTDYRSNMKQIADFIDTFKHETKKQILIRAKILEVALTDGYEFGINWNMTFSGVKFLGATGNNPAGTLSVPFSDGLANNQGIGFNNFAQPITGTISRGDLTATIKSLETQGKVTVLSSPQVSTLNGQKAIIRSVTEDVVFESQQSTGSSGNPIATTTAQPFTYGVFLDVTPHVDSEGMITMDIHPSVSSLAETKTSGGANPAQKPIIDTRETETVATIEDGETVLIAGLMADSLNENISKVPILGDIPFIKFLFRRTIKQSKKTELVILISPTLVGPRAKDFGDARQKYKLLSKLFPQ